MRTSRLFSAVYGQRVSSLESVSSLFMRPRALRGAKRRYFGHFKNRIPLGGILGWKFSLATAENKISSQPENSTNNVVPIWHIRATLNAFNTEE